MSSTLTINQAMAMLRGMDYTVRPEQGKWVLAKDGGVLGRYDRQGVIDQANKELARKEPAVTTENTTTALDVPLTVEEKQDLTACEGIIQRGMGTFIEVGNAMAAIRDSRLYRDTHGDWDTYLQERWPQLGSKRQADRLIAAAEVQRDLGPIGPALTSESQARPLTRLEPDERREAMRIATEAAPNGTPTARQVEAAAQQVKPLPAPKLPPPLAPRLALEPGDDEEIAAASAPATPPAPPMLTPLLPSVAPPPLPLPSGIDVQARKLLVTKLALVEALRTQLHDELARTATLDTPTITVRGEDAARQAQLFVSNPAFNSAAAMLGFSACVEEAPTTPRADLAGRLAELEQRIAAGTWDDATLRTELARLTSDLNAAVDLLDDATYDTLASRLSAARRAQADQEAA